MLSHAHELQPEHRELLKYSSSELCTTLVYSEMAPPKPNGDRMSLLESVSASIETLYTETLRGAESSNVFCMKPFPEGVTTPAVTPGAAPGTTQIEYFDP